MPLSQAIKVPTIVTFRVFFVEDSKIRIFFVEESPKSANSSKLAKLQKNAKISLMHECLAFFAILPILWYLHYWDKKINQIIYFHTSVTCSNKKAYYTGQFDVIFQKIETLQRPGEAN